jgi:hypothetical protein
MAGTYRDLLSSKMFSENKGVISIFLAMIISALSFMVFYSAGHLIKKKETERRHHQTDIALRSLLTDYDTKMYENYGLTVLAYSDPGALRREFVRILMKNDFKGVEDTFVKFTKSLNDKEELKQMIHEHMEHRVISKLVEELLDKFDILGSFSKFRELLEAKAVIEEVIFDCEKITVLLTTDFEGIDALDMEKALLGDTEYILYKIDEYRRLSESLRALISSIGRLLELENKFMGDSGALKEVFGRISLFSKSMEYINSLLVKAEKNISMLITCIEMIDMGEDIAEKLKGHIPLEIDLGILIPKPDLSESLKRFDLRNTKGGFFDELLLRVSRDDRVLENSYYDTEDILDNVDSFKDFFSEISFKYLAEKLYDQAVINEYILDKFSCETKIMDERFFTNEIEYILHGKSSQNENLKRTKTIILMLRAALNYAAIHLDSEKTALARSVGATISLLSFGIGSGVYAEVIMASWALYEAYKDLEKLIGGQKIAVIKAKGDYSLDFGGAVETKSPIVAGYEDYLRLFLLFYSERTKLGRISSLLCINTGLDTSLMYIGIRGGYMDDFVIEKGY